MTSRQWLVLAGHGALISAYFVVGGLAAWYAIGVFATLERNLDLFVGVAASVFRLLSIVAGGGTVVALWRWSRGWPSLLQVVDLVVTILVGGYVVGSLPQAIAQGVSISPDYMFSLITWVALPAGCTALAFRVRPPMTAPSKGPRASGI